MSERPLDDWVPRNVVRICAAGVCACREVAPRNPDVHILSTAHQISEVRANGLLQQIEERAKAGDLGELRRSVGVWKLVLAVTIDLLKVMDSDDFIMRLKLDLPSKQVGGGHGSDHIGGG